MLGQNTGQTAYSFLQRLGKNTAGNTFAMAAAAMFPIAGLVGGGVDIGRAYMAKAKLQQACDSAALAARRNMTQDTMTSADLAEANKYFNFNFPEGTFDTTDFDETVTDSSGNVISANSVQFVDGSDPRVVVGSAQTTIQTSIMRIFGFEHMVVSASCSSRLDVGNVDVMMVLDVTGSMNTTVTDGGTRLAALQDAVETFYGILGPGGGSTGEQIRYGFVPYTSTVNVGQILYDEDPSWLVGGTGVEADDRWTYQTRRATWEISAPDLGNPKSSNTSTSYQSYTYLDGPECTDDFGENEPVPGWFNPNPSGNPVVSQSESGGETTITTITYSYHSWNGSTAPPPSYAVGSSYWRDCERRVDTTVEVYDTPVPQTVDVWESGATNFSGWTYGQFTHDVSGYVASIDSSNPAVQRPTWNGSATDRWPGCIEERDTVNISATDTSIPSGALDMDIDLIPTDTSSRWRPHWKEVVYDPNRTIDGWWVQSTDDWIKDDAGFAPCPTESRRLASYTAWDEGNSTDLQSYIDGMTANGGTNHTIGMIWGARLLSPDGLFSSVNQTSSNGFQIGRHILFMTDGIIDIRKENYGSFNVNEFFGFVGPTSDGETELEARQAQRFQLMCNAAKAKGWTVWVVQFGVTTVTSNMENCASSPDHAVPATNRATLVDAFGDIAQKIGGLRLDN